MPYQIFAWIASATYGLETIFAKASNKHAVKNIWLFNYLWLFVSMLYTVPVSLVNGAGWPAKWDIVIITSLANAAFSIIYMYALSKIDVSVFSPLFNFKTVFSIILSYFLLKETLFPWQLALVGVIFVAGFFVSLDEKLTPKSFFNRNVMALLLSTLLYAVFSILINKAIGANGYWPTNLWISILSVIVLTVTWPMFSKDIKKLKAIHLLSILGVVFMGTIGNLSSFKAFAENVGISSAIISVPFSMLIAIGLSFFFPEFLEKHKLRVYAVRVVSAAVMIYAAIRLSG